MRQPPQLDAGDMPDIKALTPGELAAVPFEVWRLFCCFEGCGRYTRVRDYGIWPELWGRFKNGPWININTNRFFCAEHWRAYGLRGTDKIPPCLPLKNFSLDEVRKTIMQQEKK